MSIGVYILLEKTYETFYLVNLKLNIIQKKKNQISNVIRHFLYIAFLETWSISRRKKSLNFYFIIYVPRGISKCCHISSYGKLD